MGGFGGCTVIRGGELLDNGGGEKVVESLLLSLEVCFCQ